MYRSGIETRPVGTPPRETWTASASVMRAVRVTSNAVRDPLRPRPPRASRSETTGLTIGPRVIAAPAPSSILPTRFGLPPGHVRRPGDVDRDRDLRVERERRGARAVVAELLLHRRDGDDVDLAHRPPRPRAAATSSAAYAPSRLSSARRGDPVVRELDRLALPHADVAGAHELLGVLARCRADVDMEVGVLRARDAHAAPHARGSGGRRRPCTVRSRPAIRTRWPASCSAAKPPSTLKESRPSLADVRDRDADLVDVADERERRARPRRAPTRANEVPSVSELTSANAEAASRQTAAAGPSCPDGPTAVRRSRRSGGSGHGHKFSQMRNRPSTRRV